ncbi:hypothetical protein KAT80_03510 [Candidatus Pacearchaeota archaeon]|nr:hypothetical protein [Candidatus Pacearchaeota archaeon]
MEYYNNLKLPWIVIAKTKEGEVCDLENSQSSDKKPFYQIYFSGLGPGDFFPLSMDYFIKKRNGKLIVEESFFLGNLEEEVSSLDEAHEKMLELIDNVEKKFKGFVKKEGLNLNVYGWLGEPDINELGRITHNW